MYLIPDHVIRHQLLIRLGANNMEPRIDRNRRGGRSRLAGYKARPIALSHSSIFDLALRYLEVPVGSPKCVSGVFRIAGSSPNRGVFST